MTGSRHRSRAAALAAAGALALLSPAASVDAQQDMGGEEQLGELVETRTEGNEAAAASQQRIDEIADETDSLLSEYRTTLKQIESIDVYNTQMRDLITSQKRELTSLQSQLDRVEEVGRSVTPLMLRMIDAVEKFVALDVPFLIEERTENVQELHSVMSRADVTTAEKFRQIMEVYLNENEYGRTIEAYRATLDIDGRETTVDFLRFGRIALVYQSLDESQSGVWSQDKRDWVKLGDEYRSAIRQGLKIARKQVAPDLIRLPLPKPEKAHRYDDEEGAS